MMSRLSSKLLVACACAVVSVATSLASAPANASLINNQDGTFSDKVSGYLWRTLDQYDNLSYAQAVALLPTGFHAATEAELATLTLAAPADSTQFAADAAAMGLSPDYTILWGFYGDGSSYAWREDWNDDAWNSSAANAQGWYDFDYTVPAGYHAAGLSLFAVDTAPAAAASAVPEPASLALFGLGVAALPLTRRRRRAAALARA
jgi:hypothetical protein